MTTSTDGRLRAFLATDPTKLRIAACGLLAVLAAACGSSAPKTATTVPASPAATIAPAADRAPLACHAQAARGHPRDHTSVGIRVRTVARAWVTAAPSVPDGQNLAGRASATGQRTLWFRVGDATPGVRVVIDVSVSRHGRKGSCQASIRPLPAVPPVAPTRLAASPAASTAPASPAASTAPAPPPPSTASSCYPLSNEGTCYEPGEFCREGDHGASGVAGDGEKIICEDNDGWRWEPA
jgi:hypothetical protein